MEQEYSRKFPSCLSTKEYSGVGVLDLQRLVIQSLPWDGEDDCVISWWEKNYIRFPKGNFLDFICSANGLNQDLRLRFTRRDSNHTLSSREKSNISNSNEDDVDFVPKSNNNDAEDLWQLISNIP